MAKSKEDIKYGTAQAKLSEDESLRVAYKAGTPLEAGKIADVDTDPVDLFSAARNISNRQRENEGAIAESKPVDLFSSAGGVAKANRSDEDVANRRPSAN